MMILDNILRHFSSSSCYFLPSRLSSRPIKPMTTRLLSPFRAHLLYHVFTSFLGYIALISTSLRLSPATTRLGSLDAAFMSISAVTSSSMSTVEMEIFTNTQLILFTILMFLGGEVFTSMLGLLLQTNLEASAPAATVAGINTTAPMSPDSNNLSALAELGFVPTTHIKPNCDHNDNLSFSKLTAVKTLAYLVLGYLSVIHFCGSLFIYLYIITVPSAANILKSKSILPTTFSLFLTSSSFANCGFVPTNENMAIFKTNSFLLLLVIPQVLMGNTFYPICIRILIRVMELITKNSLYTYILTTNSAGYNHLLSSAATWWLGWTGLGLLVSQVVMLVAMDWGGSEAFAGMSWLERLVACLFQSVSSRHSGESVFDLSTLSTAVVVLFILMMYFPPYLIWMPDESDNDQAEEELRRSIESDRDNKNKKLRMENFIFSDLSYLAMFVIFISITERKSLKTDPLNFNVLSIVLEVISAYGNVGFSMGYSCKRRIEVDTSCVDKTYGFAGRWSSKGKLILIAVMIFGKFKRFNHKGGKAWITL
ncbi:unnamed protein product [Rhodiola kirilowii]